MLFGELTSTGCLWSKKHARAYVGQRWIRKLEMKSMYKKVQKKLNTTKYMQTIQNEARSILPLRACTFIHVVLLCLCVFCECVQERASSYTYHGIMTLLYTHCNENCGVFSFLLLYVCFRFFTPCMVVCITLALCIRRLGAGFRMQVTMVLPPVFIAIPPLYDQI